MSKGHPLHLVRYNSPKADGFTVIEILVTIGILVLVGAGASIIFTSVADTINAGKRVSELNRFSAQLERIMRQDFKNITRDGFMVIAHQTTVDSTGNSIDTQLSPADRSDENADGQFGRPRRIDEIMFFARGQYETSRRAISSGMIAHSTEAAIYYGHGQKQAPDLLNLNSTFFTPTVFDTNINAESVLGNIPPATTINPNRYASDWSLLRHVTLLAQPQSSGQILPDELFGVLRTGTDRQWLEDSDRQVSLQPAARSIFESLNYSGFLVATPPTIPAIYEVPKWFAEVDAGPSIDAFQSYRSSGLVDIATDDLKSIQAVVTALSADRRPFQYWDGINPIQGHEDFVAQFWEDDITDIDNLGPDKANDPSDPYRVNIASSLPGDPIFRRHSRVRQWMIDALPSVWNQQNSLNPRPLSRVRYEDIPTRLLFNDTDFALTDSGNRDRTYAEANQEMLGSSVFIPRCTEFIVEWSYGTFDPTILTPTDPRYKKMIWYGFERWIDANKDGVIEQIGNGITPGGDQRVAWLYPHPEDDTTGRSIQLIMGNIPTMAGVGQPPRTTEISTFGYPDHSGNDWPWPKFIRVTVSVADAQDLTLEDTFQIIFEIPDATHN